MATHLTFRYAHPGTPEQRVAEHAETGLSFVITHVHPATNAAGLRYEIEISDRKNQRVRLEYTHRLDSARALCERKVADRLSGADQ